MIRHLFFVALLVSTLGAQGTRADRIRSAFTDSTAPGVFVIAHRGLVSEAPENSLASIERAIARDCHMVELDVRRTRDGVYVLLHDATLNRTTTGAGKVANTSLADLQALRLLHHGMRRTAAKVPTLLDAARVARGRIMMQLDPKDVSFVELVRLARKHGFIDHLLLKQRWSRISAEDKAWLAAQPDVLFMPIVGSLKEIDAALALKPWPAFEILAPRRDHELWNRAKLDAIAKRGTRLWINSLWDGRLAAGYGDHEAALNPHGVFLPLIDRGFSMIQTDQARALARLVAASGLAPVSVKGTRSRTQRAKRSRNPRTPGFAELKRRAAGGRVLVARGGLHGPFPANSLAAIRAAIEEGFPMIRVPVRATADGELVLLGDVGTKQSLTRALRCSQSSLSELRAVRLMNGLSASSWKVALLDEALDAARGRAVLACDLRGDLIDPVRRLIEGRGPGDQVVLIQSPGRLRAAGELPLIARVETAADRRALAEFDFSILRSKRSPRPIILFDGAEASSPIRNAIPWWTAAPSKRATGFQEVRRAPGGWPQP